MWTRNPLSPSPYFQFPSLHSFRGNELAYPAPCLRSFNDIGISHSDLLTILNSILVIFLLRFQRKLKCFLVNGQDKRNELAEEIDWSFLIQSDSWIKSRTKSGVPWPDLRWDGSLVHARIGLSNREMAFFSSENKPRSWIGRDERSEAKAGRVERFL